MKPLRQVLLLSALCMCVHVFAQQKPQYTQYIFNNYIMNPAISGIENYTDVKIGYRNQWQGLEGAPVTSYVSIHAPIGKEYRSGNANSFSGGGNNPMERSYVQTYRAAEPHHGIGFHMVNDKAGPLSSLYLNLTYAYHIGLSSTANLSFGVTAGVSKQQLDISKVYTGGNIPDPAVTGGINNKFQPDLGAGVWLYGPTYFAGIAGQSLLGRTISFTENEDPIYGQGKEVPHLFFTAGYKLFLSDNIALLPSTMIKYVDPAPLTVDMNVKIAFQDKFWIGASYRKNDAIAGMLGFNFSSLFNVSYSYDYSTSDLNSVSNGTHEIVLGVLLNNIYKVTCPQRSW